MAYSWVFWLAWAFPLSKFGSISSQSHLALKLILKKSLLTEYMSGQKSWYIHVFVIIEWTIEQMDKIAAAKNSLKSKIAFAEMISLMFCYFMVLLFCPPVQMCMLFCPLLFLQGLFSPVTVTFCLNPGLKASVLKESAKYHNGDYELQPIFYTNFLINGSIDNTTDILRKSFFKLYEDFNLTFNVNDFGHTRSMNLTLGGNHLFNPINSNRLNDLEVYVRPVISALFGLCHQVETKFDMSPNIYLYFKVNFHPDLNKGDRPKVKPSNQIIGLDLRI